MKTQVVGSRPRCPNHGEPLQLSLADKTARKGVAPCPVSGALFKFEQVPEADSIVYDKYGNAQTIKTFVVDGDET